MSSKTKTTTPREDGKPALAPKLRFPEFRGAAGWHREMLGAACELYQPVTLSSSELSMTGEHLVYGANGVIGSHNKYNHEESEIAVTCRGATCGEIAITEPKSWITGNAMVVKPRTEKISKQFIFYFLKSHGLKAVISGSAQPQITRTGFAPLEISYPSPAEQQKIAGCLSSVDEVIAAQARKLDALKTHKKGLMQQLFPREGETQPRLRFSEFQNAGEWVEMELGEKVDLLSGYPFDGPDISQDCTGIPLLRGINVTEGRIRHNPEIDRYYTGSTQGLEKFMLQANDLVIGMDGSKVGKNSALVSDADAGALLIQRVARLRAKTASLIQFIFHRIHSPSFHAYVDRINTSSGIPHISAKQIKEFRIYFPCVEEQERIATFLSNLDTLITAEAKKLEALKLHKRGLMQQLFPSPEEAGA